MKQITLFRGRFVYLCTLQAYAIVSKKVMNNHCSSPFLLAVFVKIVVFEYYLSLGMERKNTALKTTKYGNQSFIILHKLHHWRFNH